MCNLKYDKNIIDKYVLLWNNIFANEKLLTESDVIIKLLNLNNNDNIIKKLSTNENLHKYIINKDILYKCVNMKNIYILLYKNDNLWNELFNEITTDNKILFDKCNFYKIWDNAITYNKLLIYIEKNINILINLLNSMENVHAIVKYLISSNNSDKYITKDILIQCTYISIIYRKLLDNNDLWINLFKEITIDDMTFFDILSMRKVWNNATDKGKIIIYIKSNHNILIYYINYLLNIKKDDGDGDGDGDIDIYKTLYEAFIREIEDNNYIDEVKIILETMHNKYNKDIQENINKFYFMLFKEEIAGIKYELKYKKYKIKYLNMKY
jgi:hypothetical protein